MNVSSLEVGLAGLLLSAFLVILVLLAMRSRLQATMRQKEGRANELEQLLLEAKRRSSQLAKAAGQWDEEIRSREERISELALRLQEIHGQHQDAKNQLLQAGAAREEALQSLQAQIEKSQSQGLELAQLKAELQEARSEGGAGPDELDSLRAGSALEDMPAGYAQRVQQAEDKVMQLTREMGNLREVERRLRRELDGRDELIVQLERRVTDMEIDEREAGAASDEAQEDRYASSVFGWAGPMEEDADPPSRESVGDLPDLLESDLQRADLPPEPDTDQGEEPSIAPEEQTDPDHPEPAVAVREPTETAQAILEDRSLSAVQKRIVLDMYCKFVRQRYPGVQYNPGGQAEARDHMAEDPLLAPRQRDTLLQIYERFAARKK